MLIIQSVERKCNREFRDLKKSSEKRGEKLPGRLTTVFDLWEFHGGSNRIK
jgi:hypothetical protein